MNEIARPEDIQQNVSHLLVSPLLEDLDQAYKNLKSKDLKTIDQLTQALAIFTQKVNEINQQVTYVNEVLRYLSQN